MNINQVSINLEPKEKRELFYSFEITEQFSLELLIESFNPDETEFVFLSYFLVRTEQKGDIKETRKVYLTSEYAPDLTYQDINQQEQTDLLSVLMDYAEDFVYSENGLQIEDFDCLLDWHEYLLIDDDGEINIESIIEE